MFRLWNYPNSDIRRLFTCLFFMYCMLGVRGFPCIRVSQNASLKSPEHHLSPPPSDLCHLCIVCLRHDCSRHFPLWLAFTQCNQCCSCLKRPLVQYLSNANHPNASTTLLLVPFRRCDKRQTVWWACVKPLDLLLCLTALALFWMSPPSCMALLYW